MTIIYLDNYSAETAGIKELVIDKLNQFEGANISEMQVLKSAAGYYIGELIEADYNPGFWEPYMRDSACYWEERSDAEEALRTGKYPVKF